MRDLLRGDLDFSFMDSGFAIQQIKAGNLRGLAVSSGERSMALTSLPTMVEAGYPGVQLESWIGVAVPANTPRKIVNKLNSVFDAILKSSKTKQILASFGGHTLPGTPETMAKLQKETIAQWRQIKQIAKIKPL